MPTFLLISRLYTHWVEYGYDPSGNWSQREGVEGQDWRMGKKKDENKIWDQEV